MMQSGGEIILEARDIVKRYPGIVALNHVTYRVHRNQVNVLIGENGAGKSTLMRILAGVEAADEGQLVLDGFPIQVRSPRDAARQGISIVHQELSVLPNLDIAENIFAGREPVKAGVLLDRHTEERRSAEALRRLRKPMDFRTSVGQIALGCRQIVEVARTLDQGAKILILDEPTSALSSAEAESLFGVIGELKRSGVTIIYISHRLNELLHLGDWFTVLRTGRIVGEAVRSEVSRQWIVERMSGRDMTVHSLDSRPQRDSTELLRVQGLTSPENFGDDVSQTRLSDISFSLRRGEILGIYGLLGAGRTELLESLVGLRRSAAGRIEIGGAAAQTRSVADAAKYGIFLVPEDRQRDGLFPDLSVRENIALGARRGFIVDRKEETARARQVAAELKIAAADLESPVAALSGGNQQKVLIARCLMRAPRILLLDEPTRGVDVNARAEIYAILRQLAQRGIGVIFSSSEIEETQALAHRVLVLCQGRIAAALARPQMTDEALFSAASPMIAAPSEMHPGAALA